MAFDLPFIRRLFFWLAYIRNRAPWDTNQTPPELIEVIEGPAALPPGLALDFGCGTGTNVIYLARHGWRAVGGDFIPAAVHQAQEKAQQAAVSAQFLVGNVLELAALPLGGPFDLGLDIGCFHGLARDSRQRYLENLDAVLKPGATYLLYTMARRRVRWYRVGVDPADVERLFTPRFTIDRVQRGTGRLGHPSAWFTMRKR